MSKFDRTGVILIVAIWMLCAIVLLVRAFE